MLFKFKTEIRPEYFTFLHKKILYLWLNYTGKSVRQKYKKLLKNVKYTTDNYILQLCAPRLKEQRALFKFRARLNEIQTSMFQLSLLTLSWLGHSSTKGGGFNIPHPFLTIELSWVCICFSAYNILLQSECFSKMLIIGPLKLQKRQVKCHFKFFWIPDPPI